LQKHHPSTQLPSKQLPPPPKTTATKTRSTDSSDKSQQTIPETKKTNNNCRKLRSRRFFPHHPNKTHESFLFPGHCSDEKISEKHKRNFKTISAACQSPILQKTRHATEATHTSPEAFDSCDFPMILDVFNCKISLSFESNTFES
jgi:hypothetical protein